MHLRKAWVTGGSTYPVSSGIVNFAKFESIGRLILGVCHFVVSVTFAVGMVKSDFKHIAGASSALFGGCEAFDSACQATATPMTTTQGLYCTWAAIATLFEIYLIVTSFGAIRSSKRKQFLISLNTADVSFALVLSTFMISSFLNHIINLSPCGKYGSAFLMSYFSLFLSLIVNASVVYIATHKRLMLAIINYSSHKYDQQIANQAQWASPPLQIDNQQGFLNSAVAPSQISYS